MSLPSAWVRQLGLKQGDELFVEHQGAALRIAPKLHRQRGKRADIDVGLCKRGIINGVLATLYTRGDDEFVLHYKTQAQFETIAEGVRSLIGFDIVEHTGKTCVIKELAHTESDNFDAVLRRIILLLVHMAEEGVLAFRNRSDISILPAKDIQVNTLVLFCLRVLNKHGVGDMQKAMHLYALLNFLEQLGDAYARLYREVKEMDKTTLSIAERIAGLMRKFYHLYYSFDLNRASALKSERDAIRADINSRIPKTRKRDDILALNHLRHIGDLIMDIEKFQLAMQI